MRVRLDVSDRSGSDQRRIAAQVLKGNDVRIRTAGELRRERFGISRKRSELSRSHEHELGGVLVGRVGEWWMLPEESVEIRRRESVGIPLTESRIGFEQREEFAEGESRTISRNLKADSSGNWLLERFPHP